MPDAEITYRRDGDTLRGYAAWPDGSAPVPGVVLVPDVRGLSEHYRDVSRRLAGEVAFLRRHLGGALSRAFSPR